jgi:hypothetical protein
VVGSVPAPVQGALVVVVGDGDSPSRKVPGRARSQGILDPTVPLSPVPKSGAPEVLKFLVFQGESFLLE